MVCYDRAVDGHLNMRARPACLYLSIAVARSLTSRVFLDTEVFVRAQFNYKSEPFQALLKHIKTGRVELFLTDLTLREIASNLETVIAETLARFSTARRKAALIKDSKAAAGLLAQPDEAAITKESIASFDAFLRECKPTVLPVKDAYLKPVLDDYFAHRPPFGEGKDKAQFPDALIVAALIDYSKHDQTICAVSGDEAFRAACNPLYHLNPYETLPAFLDDVASEDKRSAFIHEAIGKLDAEVIPIIKEQFENLSFDIFKEWGEVFEVRGEEISLGDRDVNILILEKDHALVMEYARIRFKALGERVVDTDTFEAHPFSMTTTIERDVMVSIDTDYESTITLTGATLDKREVAIRLEDE